MSSFKVGIVQMQVVDNVAENISTAISMVEKAKSQGASVVCLPEMFSCPYKSSRFPVYGEKQGGNTYTALKNCAKKNKIILVGGSVPEIDNNNVYNTSYTFDENGDLIGKHRKMHLYDVNVEDGISFTESATLAYGDRETVFATSRGTFGVGICYDIRFPEYSRALTLLGAKVIFLPAAFNMTSGPAHWDINLRCRAFENQVYLIGVSTARDVNSSYISYGHSMVISPWGETVAQLDETPGIAIADIDLNYVDKIRNEFPLLKHRRTDVYQMKLNGTEIE